MFDTDDSSPLTLTAGVGDSRFDNRGLLTKLGSGDTNLTVSNSGPADLQFTNSGIVAIEGGELSLSRKATKPNVVHTGHFDVAEVATLR